MKRKQKMNMNFFKPEPIFTLENGIGLILAILIVFDLKVEKKLSALLNSPLGILCSLLVVILMFIFLNPIVGILFLIYLYDTIQANELSTIIKDAKMKAYNPPRQTELEEKVIRDREPIIHEGENNNITFQPFIPKDITIKHIY
ncbi:hypothetical protein 162322294 [Organic Lake phycodnavirus 1]|jgi:hypothetical protein|nr:hypothetical protein 162322294 [Organic Lake phycodnavirus 1]